MKKLLCVIGVVMAFTMTNNIKAAGPQRTTARWSDNSYLYQDVLYALGLSVSAFTTATATVSGDLSVGSMSCPGDLGITASNLTVKLRAAASTDLGRFAVRSLEAVADRSDSDYAEWALLEAYDSQTNWQTFARFKIISSDITSADEDCTIQLWYDIAGTPTLGAVWDSGGLTVKGLKNEGLTVSKPVFTDAASKLTSAGILGADQGGTGTNTLTEHGVMIGSGTGVVNVTGVGTDGQVFIGASTADPGWQTASGAFTMAANGAATLAGNIDIARITNALKVPGNIGETTPGEGSFSDLDITVRADIGGWGYSGEHAELVEDATGNTVPGFGHYNEIKTEITSGKVMAAKYTRLLCSSNQANDVTMVGTESQFRLRNVNIANGVHAGLWAYAEQSGTSVLSGNGTFDAIAATVESADTFTVGATEQVTGIMLDSSIGASATIAGAANFSAMYIKSNGKDWFNGLYITGCDNAILFDGGATIDQSAADTLTITEDNVAVAGALTATSYEGVVAATLVAGAAAGATAVQPADIWGAPTATPSPVLLTNTVAIQAKTDAGGDLSDYRVIRVWTSETSMGEASTNNIESIALSTGAAIETKTADADYIYLTASDGSAQAIIIGSATGTNYVMLMDGSSVSATAITFLP